MTLQNELNSKYGYDLYVDGYFGDRTLDAVRKFQFNHNCDVDGIVGPQTWGAIYGGGGPSPAPTPQATPTSTVSTSHSTLRENPSEYNSEVVELQKDLNFIDDESARIAEDGYFGGQTLQAVLAFHGMERITQDGIVGPQTWGKLESYCATLRGMKDEFYVDRGSQGTDNSTIDLSGIKPEDVTRDIAKFLIGNPMNVYATQQGWFRELFYAAGFVRDSNGVYHARQDCLQQYGGYNNFYDFIFYYSTSMDNAKFQFSYGNRDYIFWAWKGDYLNLGAGAEMGIYTRLVVNGTPTDHWLVDQSLAMSMTLTLEDNKGNTIADYKPSKKQWWVTGFNPYYQNVQASELTANYIINFSGKESMYNDFYNTWNDDKRWKFTTETHTVTFIF